LRKRVTGTSFLVTQPYLSYRRWLLHAQAVSAAPAASFKSSSRAGAGRKASNPVCVQMAVKSALF
jgi:hypothetical protein